MMTLFEVAGCAVGDAARLGRYRFAVVLQEIDDVHVRTGRRKLTGKRGGLQLLKRIGRGRRIRTLSFCVFLCREEERPWLAWPRRGMQKAPSCRNDLDRGGSRGACRIGFHHPSRHYASGPNRTSCSDLTFLRIWDCGFEEESRHAYFRSRICS